MLTYVFKSCIITWSSFPPENIFEFVESKAKQKILLTWFVSILAGAPFPWMASGTDHKSTLLSSPPVNRRNKNKIDNKYYFSIRNSSILCTRCAWEVLDHINKKSKLQRKRKVYYHLTFKVHLSYQLAWWISETLNLYLSWCNFTFEK